MEDKQMQDLINTAIQREEEAYEFYMDILNRVEDQSGRDTLEFIAGEEKKHRDFLVAYRDGDYGADALRMNDPVDFKIAEHLEEPKVEDEMHSKDIYLIAAHRELRAYNFYTELANLHP